jgi:hypothetical protein
MSWVCSILIAEIGVRSSAITVHVLVPYTLSVLSVKLPTQQGTVHCSAEADCPDVSAQDRSRAQAALGLWRQLVKDAMAKYAQSTCVPGHLLTTSPS